eukprot:Rmarinus@m.11017
MTSNVSLTFYGSTFALLLRESAGAVCDSEGLLLGTVSTSVSVRTTDGAPTNEICERISVQSFIPAPTRFPYNYGKRNLDPSYLKEILSESLSDLSKKSYKGPKLGIIGWYSARRNAPLRQSLRDIALHDALFRAVLELSQGGLRENLHMPEKNLFAHGIVGGFSEEGTAGCTHTFDALFFHQVSGANFIPIKTNIVNLGGNAQLYQSFHPASWVDCGDAPQQRAHRELLLERTKSYEKRLQRLQVLAEHVSKVESDVEAKRKRLHLLRAQHARLPPAHNVSGGVRRGCVGDLGPGQPRVEGGTNAGSSLVHLIECGSAPGLGGVSATVDRTPNIFTPPPPSLVVEGNRGLTDSSVSFGDGDNSARSGHQVVGDSSPSTLHMSSLPVYWSPSPHHTNWNPWDKSCSAPCPGRSGHVDTSLLGGGQQQPLITREAQRFVPEPIDYTRSQHPTGTDASDGDTAYQFATLALNQSQQPQTHFHTHTTQLVIDSPQGKMYTQPIHAHEPGPPSGAASPIHPDLGNKRDTAPFNGAEHSVLGGGSFGACQQDSSHSVPVCGQSQPPSQFVHKDEND